MITGYEAFTVQGDFITCDLIVWRRYRRPTKKIVEAMLDLNPHLAALHKTSPFLPVGTQVRIPIDLGVLSGAPQPVDTRTIWGTAKGYTL